MPAVFFSIISALSIFVAAVHRETSMFDRAVMGMTTAVAAATAAVGALAWPVLQRLYYVWRYPPVRDSRQHGGERVVDVLLSHNVTHVFTLTGGHVSPILAAAEQRGVRVIDTRHEATAVFAADATARLTGGVGVAVVTAGPGLTNTLTAVQNAAIAESPVLLLAGAAAGILRGRGALQDIDQLALLRPVCKLCVSVRRVRDIVPCLLHALQTACSDTPGPVLVELPIDVLYPYSAVSRELLSPSTSGTRRRSAAAALVAAYLRFYVDDLFAGGWNARCLSPLTVRRPLAGDADVAAVAGMLQSAQRPLLLVGSSVVTYGGRGTAHQVRAALERLGVPCFLAGGARGLLGGNSRLQYRHGRREALRHADVVVLLGVSCDFRLGYGRQLSGSSRVAIVHRCRRQLRLNAGTFWRPARAVCGDVADFVCRLAARPTAVDDTWRLELAQRESDAEERVQRLASAAAGNHVNPLALLRHIDARLTDDAILVVDGGDFVGSAAYTVRPSAPLGWLDPGAFGTLGVGAGFALAAGLLCPGRPVWLLYGDGACGFSLVELDTLRRHNVSVIAVVGNDACWTQIAREQVSMFGTSVACRLEHTRYDTVARGLGAHGVLLERDEDSERCLDEALQHAVDGQSALVNALIDNTSFRDGSVSV